MAASDKTNDIIECKYKADAIKYFNLFDKYIPANLKRKDIYLRDISNVDVLYNIIKKNSSCNYFINDVEDVFNILRIRCKIDFPKTNLIFYNPEELDMKFDLIIMNPPYQRNLHLKILEEAIQHLKNDKSVCINLSPIRWLQDPLAKYKKTSDLKRFEESVAKHIEMIDIINSDTSNVLFNAGIMCDLGVYKCNKYIYDEYLTYNTNIIIDKIFKATTKTFNDVLEYKKRDGWRWQISELQPINAQGGAKGTYGWYRRFCIFNHLRSTIYYNGKYNNKDWTFFTSGVSNDETGTIPMPWSIKFNSENEAHNCENSTKTTLYKYYILNIKSDQHTPFKYIPFLGDAINPRTGLKGYEGEWTDEDLYTFFEITPKEQKIIEETMAKYK